MRMKTFLFRSAVTVVAATGWVLWFTCVPGAATGVASAAPESYNATARAPESSLAPAPRPRFGATSPGDSDAAPGMEPVTRSGDAQDSPTSVADARLDAASPGPEAESATAKPAHETVSEALVAAVLESWGRRPVETLEELSARLEFDARSSEEAARIIAETKSRLLALRRTPADDGQTWEQAQLATVQMKEGSLVLDLSQLADWRCRMVPNQGEGETYGIAEARILTAARDRIGDLVSGAMKDAFSKVQLTQLFGPLPPESTPFSLDSLADRVDGDLNHARLRYRFKTAAEHDLAEDAAENRPATESKDR